MGTSILIIIIALILSAFFSGMEIAYISSNRIHLEIEKKQDGLLATILTRLTKKPSKFIATMLVGNNLALVVYGFFMGEVVVAWIQDVYPTQSDFLNALFTEFNLLFQTIISTLIILLTAEFLPKVFFQIYSNKLIKFFALPAYLFYVMFSFISDFIIWMSDFVLKVVFKSEGDEVQLSFSKVELGDYISEQMESVGDNDDVDSEIQIFRNALEFAEVKAREVMIPRTEITAVEIHEQPSGLVKLFTKTGFSKILVYLETIDDIVGYVHSFELFKKPKTIKSIMMPVEFVPETMLISDILEILMKKRKSIAVVLDEYGGTSGILTVEDIIEELFGEIEDEHDNDVQLEEQISKNEYLFSARLDVDYLNEEYRLNLPESENYETLGGLIVNHLGEIPEVGEIIKIESLQFEIKEVGTTKIDLILLKVLNDE